MKFSKSCSGRGSGPGSGLVWARGQPLRGDGWGRGCVGGPSTAGRPGGQRAPGGLLTRAPLCALAQLGGCGILGVGIWLAATQGNFATLSSSFPSLSAANLLIVTGAFVMAIGFVGCIGAIKENKCLLLTVSPVGEQAGQGAALTDTGARVHVPPQVCQAQPVRLALGLFSPRSPPSSCPSPFSPPGPCAGRVGPSVRAGWAARLRLAVPARSSSWRCCWCSCSRPAPPSSSSPTLTRYNCPMAGTGCTLPEARGREGLKTDPRDPSSAWTDARPSPALVATTGPGGQAWGETAGPWRLQRV